MGEAGELLREIRLTAEAGLGRTEELRCLLNHARLPQAGLLALLWDDLLRRARIALRPARSEETAVLRPCLIELFRLAAEIGEAHDALSRALPSTLPPGSTEAVRAEVERLARLTSDLGKATAALYGRREALLIVAPAFQESSGLTPPPNAR